MLQPVSVFCQWNKWTGTILSLLYIIVTNVLTAIISVVTIHSANRKKLKKSFLPFIFQLLIHFQQLYIIIIFKYTKSLSELF